MSAGLDAVVRHCLEKNPGERFQSARDLAFALQSVSGLSSRSGAPIALPPDRRRWIVPLCAALVAFAAFFVGSRAGEHRARSSVPKFRRLTFRRGNVLFARFTPDGQNVVYSAAWDDKPTEIFVTRIGRPESRPLGIPNADVLSVSRTGELAIKLKKHNLYGTAGAGTLARVPPRGRARKSRGRGAGGLARRRLKPHGPPGGERKGRHRAPDAKKIASPRRDLRRRRTPRGDLGAPRGAKASARSRRRSQREEEGTHEGLDLRGQSRLGALRQGDLVRIDRPRTRPGHQRGIAGRRSPRRLCGRRSVRSRHCLGRQGAPRAGNPARRPVLRKVRRPGRAGPLLVRGILFQQHFCRREAVAFTEGREGGGATGRHTCAEPTVQYPSSSARARWMPFP